MHMLLPAFHRSTLPSLCLLALLAGCASKNPLMEEPATASTPAAKPATAAPTATAATTPDTKPAAVPAPAPVAAAPAAVKPVEAAPVKPTATIVTPTAVPPAAVTAVAPPPAKPVEAAPLKSAATAAATPVAPPATTTTAAPAPAVATSAPAKPTEVATTKSASGGVQTTESHRLFGIFSPYRIDIQQGNFVSREMVAQLKPGMTPEQVRFALGTPLLTDIFHADRWDYVFRLKKGNGEILTSKVVLRFKDNRLATIDGADLPTERDYLSLIAGTPTQEPAKPAAPAAPVPVVPAAAASGPSMDPAAMPAPK